MDCELVTDSQSETARGGNGNNRPSLTFRYGDKFEEMCAFYMSIGMTYEQYWDGDNVLTKYYKKADELKRERENHFLWLQGIYVYEAIIDASPILNPMSKKHKPTPYRSEPIPITQMGSEEAEERANEKKLQNGKEAMRAMMAGVNKKFKQEGGVKNGS